MEYVITNAQQRDSWESKYGPMVSYAISLEGQTGWHQLNQKPDTPPPKAGDTILGVIETAKTKNNVEYKKFKKQNPKFAGAPVGGGIPNDKLEYIIKMLEELTDRRPAEDTSAPQGDVVLNDIEKHDDPFDGLGI